MKGKHRIMFVVMSQSSKITLTWWCNMCLTWGNKLTEDDMNGTSSAHVKEEKCVHNFRSRAWRERLLCTLCHFRMELTEMWIWSWFIPSDRVLL